MADKLIRIPGAKKRNKAFPGTRSVKMFRPVCKECQQGAAGTAWWDNCEHDPYFQNAPREIKTPNLIDDPDEKGSQIVDGYTTKIKWEVVPNIAQVQQNHRTGIAGTDTVSRFKRRGYVMPEEKGYAPFCQLNECWSQDIQVRTPEYGDYCSILHAKAAVADALEITLEVIHEQKAKRQVAKIPVGV